MKATIIERNWVVEWFDERQCYHMPSLTMADNGDLLAVWNGGFLQWNGDPMGRDAKDWVSVLPRGGHVWSNPDAVGCDIRYCCHDPIFIKNNRGEIILLFAKFLDTETNFLTWCNGRDQLWMRKTRDCGRTWEPAKPDTPPTTAPSCRTAPLSSPLPAASCRTNISARCAFISQRTAAIPGRREPFSVPGTEI